MILFNWLYSFVNVIKRQKNYTRVVWFKEYLTRLSSLTSSHRIGIVKRSIWRRFWFENGMEDWIMPVHFVKQISSGLNLWKMERHKREKDSSLQQPTNINFPSIFSIFDSIKSVEDSWLLCIYVFYGQSIFLLKRMPIILHIFLLLYIL